MHTPTTINKIVALLANKAKEIASDKLVKLFYTVPMRVAIMKNGRTLMSWSLSMAMIIQLNFLNRSCGNTVMI
ncbi:hypothetical protein DSOL_4928 [Desulfosporosinus metallidurans]|uniref:Uncharacterized protein n=1 Tax=Desulfosporosinus metallidurans TaxID=1888891 RepID=A0A1Q8QGV1_9FIRM|nr:hypothetical protein DSOL_4928 [Desulfosporosinus metallidurans]